VEAFVYPSNTNTLVDRYLRLSRLTITPMDYVSFYELKKLSFEKNEIIEVCSSFNESDYGYGETRFQTLVAAHNAAQVFIDKKTRIRVMPGYYDEFETVWAGVDGENSAEYKGIICKNNVIYESFDPDTPSLTTLKWDGHAGFSPGYVMNTDTQAAPRCIFHITTPETRTKISGFKLWSKNTRYCLHPESAGSGAKSSWILENLIFDWNGRPETVQPTWGTHLGIGISSGEIGHVIRCKFEGTVIGGLAGHNNGWYVPSQGEKPFICPGAKLHIIGCDFNGNNFEMATYQEDADLPDSLIIEDCVGIDTAEFTIIGAATAQNWKAQIVNSNIINNNL
jgi:hypothetical protein